MKQWILAKFLCDRVYFWAIFYATGYRVLSSLPHTTVTSLVKYPPPRLKNNSQASGAIVACFASPFSWLKVLPFFLSTAWQGRTQPEVEERAISRVGAKKYNEK